MHQLVLVVAMYLLSGLQMNPKHAPGRKSNPGFIQNAKPISSPKIVLLTWSTFPNGSTQKRDRWCSSPLSSSFCMPEVAAPAGDALWVSVCPVPVSVGFVLHGEAHSATAACCSCSFCRVLRGCPTLAGVSGRVRGDGVLLWLNTHLNREISAAKCLGGKKGGED